VRSIRLAKPKARAAQAPAFMYLFTWTTPRLRIDRDWLLERDPLQRARRAWDDVPTGPTSRPWSRVFA
jgi:hypothetical protein